MKTQNIALAVLLLAAACGPISQRQYWHDRLYAVDHTIISDSAIWAISEDTMMVKEIEKSDSASRAVYASRKTLTLQDSIARANASSNAQLGTAGHWHIGFDSTGPFRFRYASCLDPDGYLRAYRVISRADSNRDWKEEWTILDSIAEGNQER